MIYLRKVDKHTKISKKQKCKNITNSKQQQTKLDELISAKPPCQNDKLIIYRGENLPHWQSSSAVYHVCTRLNDSVPEPKLTEWIKERKKLKEIAIKEKRLYSEAEVKRLRYLYSDKIMQYLDAGYGACIFKNDDIAQIVKDTLEYFNGQHYWLHAWCIMPNHLHVIFELLNGYLQADIVHGWKSYTAHVINKLLGQKGSVWQQDYYNHIIRTEEEYYQQIRYVWNNLVKAYLHEWKWRWMCLSEKKAPEEVLEKFWNNLGNP